MFGDDLLKKLEESLKYYIVNSTIYDKLNIVMVSCG